MQKTSVYEVDALWQNVGRNFGIIFLLTLVAFTFWFAYKESFLQNAFDSLQRCLFWLRHSPRNRNNPLVNKRADALSNNEEAWLQEQSKLNEDIEEDIDKRKHQYRTQPNSNIFYNESQRIKQLQRECFSKDQKIRQLQQKLSLQLNEQQQNSTFTGKVNRMGQTQIRSSQKEWEQQLKQELSKLQQDNKELAQKMKKVQIQLEKELLKSSRVLSPKEEFYTQTSIKQRDLEEFRNQKPQTSSNLISPINSNAEQINEEHLLKKQCSIQVRNIQDTINKKDIQIKQLENKLDQTQKQNKYLKESLQNTQKTSNSSIERENALRKIIGQLQKKAEQNQSSKLAIQKQIKDLSETKRRLEKQMEQLKSGLKSKQAENFTLAQSKRQIEDYIRKLELQNQNKNRELQDYRSLIEEYKKTQFQKVQEITQLTQKFNNAHLNLQSQEQLIKNKDDNLDKVERRNKELQSALQEHQRQSQELIDHMRQRQQQLLNAIRQKDDQIHSKNIQMEGIYREREAQQQQFRNLEDQLARYQSKLHYYSTLKQEVSNLRLQLASSDTLMHLFSGDIIQEMPEHKQFIKQAIEDYTKKKIFKTKKLYTSEKDLNFSFHKYVDQVPDIVVIVKTIAGFYLAGYSQSPISSKVPANKGGLIMALNNKKVFKLISGKRSVTYDAYFLIIGNSEIRLKNQQWKVFSNFGIANSFFSSDGCGVNDLLGEGPAIREVPIVDFEVHRVIFQ